MIKLIKKIDYTLFTTLIATKIADAILTAIALPLGAIELNPMGFNLPSIIFTFGITSLLMVVLLTIHYPETPYVVGIGLLILNMIGAWVITHNTGVLLTLL